MAQSAGSKRLGDRVGEHIDALFPQMQRPDRARLLKLARQIDDLPRLDEDTNECYVDERSLRVLLKEAFPPQAEDRFIAAARALPDSRLVDRADGRRLRAASWDEVGRRGVFRQPGDGDVEDPGLHARASGEEIRRAVKQRSPEIPDDVFEDERLLQIAEQIVGPAGSDATTEARMPDVGLLFDCLVRSIGWWGVMLLTAALVVIVAAAGLAIALSGGLAGLIWPLFWFYFWELLVILGLPAVAGVTLSYILSCLVSVLTSG